ncbi:preprotein translocase subunit SecE [uncultured Thalassolituus sp.]|uniref:preprotein translocase subunit SecE n=1 Tax=uncultured Thalassolituus sp. TaxID=285273 RepID=UPI00262BEBAC|nr:preprotein translocase subunit SecE [uncultured Thalassolituus sp.]
MSTDSKASGSVFDIVKWMLAIALLGAAISGNYVFPELGTLYRVLAVVALMLAAVGVALTTTKGQAFMVLLKEANKERRKVVWPTPVETRQTTMIVVAVVILVGLGLWGLDSLLSYLVELVIG